MSNVFPGAQNALRLPAACALLILFAGNLPAQVLFTNMPIAAPGVDTGWAAWGDYDNDGRLDFALLGYDSLNPLTEIWRNTGSGFTQTTVPGLPGAYDGVLVWGDYDNDGRLDFLLTGHGRTSRIAQLWRNTGGGFATVDVPGLPGVEFSAAAWGDFDNDGRLDFLITGSSTSGAIAQLWRNTGAGFTNVPIPDLPGVILGSVAWGDYDNDGRLDFLITGYTAPTRICQLWRNTGTGFTNVPIPGLPGVQLGGAIWGDYDGDGRLDFLLTGTTNGAATGVIAQMWRNTGNGLVNVPIPGLPGVYYSAAAWGDYDNDGRLDFLLTGSTNGTADGVVAQLWRNTGAGFSSVSVPGLPGVDGSSVAWGDYDNNGRLDFLMTGYTGSSFVSQLWRSTGAVASNAPPAEPSGLASSVSGHLVSLFWNMAADDHTPSATLSYNLRVGTSAGAGDVLSPQAASGGFRSLPALGNCQLRTNAQLTLPSGIYYWSVQAVDGAFAGSPFASAQVFTVESAVSAPRLVNEQRLGNGAFQFTFTNTPGASFTVFATTNLGLPFSNWPPIGTVPEIASGQFQFTDTQATNSRLRFYRVRWP
jgi:hypothetical protein